MGISHNEGPTYDYLMEHPPNDRILPVLEKVVDQLKHPVLDSDKEKRSTKTYQKDIDDFFKEQTPDFWKYYNGKLPPELVKTCIIFKKNTNDTNFNIFELFINIMDIYDRILYHNRYGVTKPEQITGDIKRENHFASKLNEDDYAALNKTLFTFKDSKFNSFYPRLENNKITKINDELRDFQLISLAFILFIKGFMCQTGNCLEQGNHAYKAPKSRSKQSKKKGKS